MKTVVYTCIVSVLLMSCKNNDPIDYITLSGEIFNMNSDSLIITSKSGYKKGIKLKPDGSFKDTLRTSAASLNIFDGKNYAYLFAKMGDDIKMTIDAKQFDESITFFGEGAGASNFKAKLNLEQAKLLDNDSVFKLNEREVKKKFASIRSDFTKRIDTTSGLDSIFIKDQKAGFDGFIIYLEKLYREKKNISNNMAKGMESPKFLNYENFKGGKASLKDFKGKYLYIDFWATWCEPCKYQIPYLKKVEKAYQDRNIEFISISVDKPKDREKWLQMVKEKNLEGVQLFANGDGNFMKSYKVGGIPRFILLDPEGKIVMADAPRPSDEKLIKLFDTLDI